jgi:hypothetical protein
MNEFLITGSYDTNFDGDTDAMVSEINYIICQAADQCAKKKGFMIKTKPKNSLKFNKPKWYDTSLIKATLQKINNSML